MPMLAAKKCRYVDDDGSQCRRRTEEGSNLCKWHLTSAYRPEMDRVVFRTVNDRFMQDVREFFTRSNFYLVAEAALLSVLFAVGEPDTTFTFLISIVLGASGFILALLWLIAATGAVMWISRWREEILRLDSLLDRFGSIRNVELEKRAWCKYPEKVTTLIPVLFLLAWVGVLAIVSLAHIGWLD